ncbi:hypothetical protein HUJ04_000209 [Dendroctonus ponderosae]|nr:hypothetical protein HUJ04_000209 [Dendroctonus ponderosae]
MGRPPGLRSAERQSANRLYLRFPVKIADQHQILSLHPKIALVRLPRQVSRGLRPPEQRLMYGWLQKSRRWCIIECASQTDLEEVRGCLKRLKVDGKSLKVKSCRPARPKEAPPATVTAALEALCA